MAWHQRLLTAPASWLQQALRWNAASTLGQMLGLVTQDNRHQQVLNLGLDKLSAALGTPKVRAIVSEQINAFLQSKGEAGAKWELGYSENIPQL